MGICCALPPLISISNAAFAGEIISDVNNEITKNKMDRNLFISDLMSLHEI